MPRASHGTYTLTEDCRLFGTAGVGFPFSTNTGITFSGCCAINPYCLPAGKFIIWNSSLFNKYETGFNCSINANALFNGCRSSLNLNAPYSRNRVHLNLSTG